MQGIWLLLALNGLGPTPSASADCAASLCWQVSPQVCVTEQQQQSCQAQLQLQWHSKTAQDLCLFLGGQRLHCWYQSAQGQWQQQLQWQNADLTLRNPENQVLLHTELQVQSRKPARRRLSSPWSIF